MFSSKVSFENMPLDRLKKPKNFKVQLSTAHKSQKE